MDQSRNSGGYIFTVNLKSMQVILPISMLSFLFSQSPVFDGLLNFLQIYGFDSTSTLSIRAERAYAFLLFNGLLALLIKNSGALKKVPELITSSLKTAIETTIREDIEEEDGIVADHVTEQVLAGDHEDCVESEEDDSCDDTNDVLSDDEEDEDDRFDDHDNDYILADESDEEEMEEVVVWGISVEELNTKCDDFIKNMRHLL